MSERKQELVARLSRADERLSAQARGAVAEDWPDIELTIAQLRALGLLNHAPQRMSDLAAALGSSVSSATSLVERLEGKGLVERVHDPVDRRVVQCHLTVGGRTALERFWRIRRSYLASIVEVLTVEELGTVVAALELLVAAFERRANGAQ